MTRRAAPLLALALLLAAAPAPARPRSHRREAKAEVTVLAVVESTPREKTHQNGRSFEEMDAARGARAAAPARAS